MTFAEFAILVVIALAFYRLLRPVRKWLESRLYRLFRSKSKRPFRTVIDMTDYSKKKGPNDEN